jgi:hypothetical protein
MVDVELNEAVSKKILETNKKRMALKREAPLQMATRATLRRDRRGNEKCKQKCNSLKG